MTVELDVFLILDVFGVLCCATLVAGTLAAPKPTIAQKALCCACWGLLTAAVLTGCASTPPGGPDESRGRCLGLLALACDHDDACGGRDRMTCFSSETGVCQNASGLTDAEADACAKAMLETECGGPFPAVCRGILLNTPPAATALPPIGVEL